MKKLKKLYPYQFSGKNIGLYVAKGWIGDFEKLCKDIDDLLGENKRGFHWVQLKEKFGSARYYYSMSKTRPSIRIDIINPINSDGQEMNTSVSSFLAKTKSKNNEQELIDKIDKLVGDAENKTTRICIECGEEGSHDNLDGYILVVCDKHKKERRISGRLLKWDDEDL